MSHRCHSRYRRQAALPGNRTRHRLPAGREHEGDRPCAVDTASGTAPARSTGRDQGPACCMHDEGRAVAPPGDRCDIGVSPSTNSRLCRVVCSECTASAGNRAVRRASSRRIRSTYRCRTRIFSARSSCATGSDRAPWLPSAFVLPAPTVVNPSPVIRYHRPPTGSRSRTCPTMVRLLCSLKQLSGCCVRTPNAARRG